MNEVINVSKEQFDQFLSNFENECEQLCDSEIEKLATKLNGFLNLPLIDEEKEQQFYRWLLLRIDNELFQALPKEWYNFLRNSIDGLTPEHAEFLKKALTNTINDKIDIRFLPESLERALINFGLDVLFKAILKDYSIEKLNLAA